MANLQPAVYDKLQAASKMIKANPISPELKLRYENLVKMFKGWLTAPKIDARKSAFDKLTAYKWDVTPTTEEINKDANDYMELRNQALNTF